MKYSVNGNDNDAILRKKPSQGKQNNERNAKEPQQETEGASSRETEGVLQPQSLEATQLEEEMGLTLFLKKRFLIRYNQMKPF